MRRYRRREFRGNVGKQERGRIAAGVSKGIAGFCRRCGPGFKHMTRPPNRFLFGGWAYAGRLNRDIGKFPGFGRLPHPSCAARTPDDRDGPSIAGPAGPGTRGDKRILKKGAPEAVSPHPGHRNFQRVNGRPIGGI